MSATNYDHHGRCEPDQDRRMCVLCGSELVPGPAPGCAFTWDHNQHDRPFCQTHDSDDCRSPR